MSKLSTGLVVAVLVLYVIQFYHNFSDLMGSVGVQNLTMLNSIYQFLVLHWVATVYVFTAAITAISPPGKSAGGFYGWFYRFCQALIPIASHVTTPPSVPVVPVPRAVPVVASVTKI
jgi:hypothetical protein